jgi:predicted nucleic acid-binding protein
MTVPEFLDTNVLLYAYDSSDSKKQRIAAELVRRAMTGDVITSTQVLAEFAAALLHRVSPPAPANQLETIFNALAPIRMILPDAAMVQRALEAHARYGIHFYEGMIVAAAERGGCRRLWSEDFNDGQNYFGVAVQNPFREQH